MGEISIVAENLTYRYGDFLAVDHISFDVSEIAPDVFVLIGLNIMLMGIVAAITRRKRQYAV